MNFYQLLHQYKAKVMEVNAHAFTGNATPVIDRTEFLVRHVELVQVGQLPSHEEIMSYNPQQTWGPVLSGLFGCDVVVESVFGERIHFALPTTTNWCCFVEVMVTGCSDGFIKCAMTVDELNRQLDLDSMLANCGI